MHNDAQWSMAGFSFAVRHLIPLLSCALVFSFYYYLPTTCHGYWRCGCLRNLPYPCQYSVAVCSGCLFSYSLLFVSHVLGCLVFSELGTALSYLLNSRRVPRRDHKQKKTAPRRMPLFTLFNLLTAEPLSVQWRQPKCINGTGCRRLRR